MKERGPAERKGSVVSPSVILSLLLFFHSPGHFPPWFIERRGTLKSSLPRPLSLSLLISEMGMMIICTSVLS